jgi:probable phosphoglycerate mutase
MSTAILIRPGETDFDQQSRIQGGLDLPLSETGRQQVRELIAAVGVSINIVMRRRQSRPARPGRSRRRWTCR